MSDSELIKLHMDTNAILGALDRSSIDDAVNWGDLSCVEAARVSDQDGYSYLQVRISEAAPDADKLSEAVREKLAEKGWDDVTVLTEW